MAVIPLQAIADTAKTGINVTHALATGFSRANVAERKSIKSDTKALKKDQLGMSDAEKNTALANQLAQLRAQNAAATGDLNRQQAASGAPAGGAYFNAVQQANAQTQGQAGVLGGQLQAQSDQMAAQRRADIIARIENKSARNQAQASALGNAGAAPVAGNANIGPNLLPAHDIATKAGK